MEKVFFESFQRAFKNLKSCYEKTFFVIVWALISILKSSRSRKLSCFILHFLYDKYFKQLFIHKSIINLSKIFFIEIFPNYSSSIFPSHQYSHAEQKSNEHQKFSSSFEFYWIFINSIYATLVESCWAFGAVTSVCTF